MTERRSRWPVDASTHEPIEPREQPGYYAGFSTLAQAAFWDEATRRVVLARVHEIPPIRFFSSEELPIARAVFDRVLPQDDRDDAHKIPIVEFVDARLHEGKTAGYRYDDMPSDGQAYRLGLRAIDEIARHLHGRGFVGLDSGSQDAVLETLASSSPPASHDVWKQMNVKHFWRMLVNDAADVYYAHPFAWDEIGFGGPAYPRGYMRLTNGTAEPWEVDERRYEWSAPPASRSDVLRPLENTTQSGNTDAHGSEHPRGSR